MRPADRKAWPNAPTCASKELSAASRRACSNSPSDMPQPATELPTRLPALKLSIPSLQSARASAVLTDRSPTAADSANDRSLGMTARSLHRRSGTATTSTFGAELVTDNPGVAPSATAGVSMANETANAATPAPAKEPVRVTRGNRRAAVLTRSSLVGDDLDRAEPDLPQPVRDDGRVAHHHVDEIVRAQSRCRGRVDLVAGDGLDLRAQLVEVVVGEVVHDEVGQTARDCRRPGEVDREDARAIAASEIELVLRQPCLVHEPQLGDHVG